MVKKTKKKFEEPLASIPMSSTPLISSATLEQCPSEAACTLLVILESIESSSGNKRIQENKPSRRKKYGEFIGIAERGQA